MLPSHRATDGRGPADTSDVIILPTCTSTAIFFTDPIYSQKALNRQQERFSNGISVSNRCCCVPICSSVVCSAGHCCSSSLHHPLSCGRFFVLASHLSRHLSSDWGHHILETNTRPGCGPSQVKSEKPCLLCQALPSRKAHSGRKVSFDAQHHPFIYIYVMSVVAF